MLSEKISGILSIEQNGDTCIVALGEKIDAKNYELIQKKVFDLLDDENENSIKDLIFDFKETIYISSAGLRMFAATNQKAHMSNTNYKLINVRDPIFNVFTMTGYTSTLIIERFDEN